MSDEAPGIPPHAPGVATRWCAPASSRPDLTRHGLLDTTAIGRDWYDGDPIDPVSALAGAPHSYVLLAAGGAGKTTLIQQLRRDEPGSVSIDLRMVTEQALPGVIQDAANHDIVYLDALDEALQRMPTAGYTIAAILAEENSTTTRWRLACRPGSWSSDLAGSLRETLPDFRELQLLPLDRSGIDEMAGTHAEAFWDAVEQHGLLNLLARPLDAQVLLDDWRDSGQLPASRSDAMHHSVRRLLAETGQFRPQRQQDDRRMRLVAERLAAVALFSGAARFQPGNAPSSTAATAGATDLTTPEARNEARNRHQSVLGGPLAAGSIAVTAIPVDDEPDLPGGPVSLDDVREVLATGLFASAGGGELAFVHQSYTEYLAASFLARRNVTGPRLSALLGADTNGTTPGPMLEVLGWLLALGAEIPDDVVERNAKALLGTAGLELADDPTRHGIVAALLRGASDGSIDEGWGTDLSHLAHPDLAGQLHDAATTASNRWEVFWIARLARHCLVFDAADDLLALAHSASWPAFIRAEAVHAFAALAPMDRLTEIESLLDLPGTEDPDDELHTAAIRAIMRGRPSVETIASALRPPRASHRGAGYPSLLKEIPTLVQPDQTLPLLQAVLPQLPQHGSHAYERLITGLIGRIWEVRDPETLDALGKELGLTRATRIIRPHEPYPWQREDDPTARRRIAQTALAAGSGAPQEEVGKRAALTVFDMGLIGAADITWLIDWIGDAADDVIAAGLFLLSRIVDGVTDPATADVVLGIDETHPAHPALAGSQGFVELADRPEWATWQMGHRDAEATRAALYTLRQKLAASHHSPDTWWQVVVALSEDPEDTGVVEWDLTSRPFWASLTEQEQKDFWQTGLVYLQDHVPTPDTWRNLTSYNLTGVLPDWAGAFALGTMARHRPDLIEQVSASTWQTWAPTLVHVKQFNDAHECLRAVKKLFPDGVRGTVSGVITDLARTDVGAAIHHPLADMADADLLRVVENVARNPASPPKQREAAVHLLIQESPLVALDVARAADIEQPRFPAMAAALATLAPEEYVASMIAEREAGDAYALGQINLSQLSDKSLVDLADLLTTTDTTTDTSTDEQAAGPGRAVSTTRRSMRPALDTEHEDVLRVRYRCFETMADRGLVTGLERFASAESSVADEARHVLPRARQYEALLHWRPVDPGTLFKVVTTGDARLVRDSAGLASVLLEQLSRIQTDLQGVPLYRHLWDGEPGGERSSPKVEDDISDWLANQLELRLTPHVVVDREIQVTRRGHAGVGTRIDITVTGAAGERLGRVAFEAKRVENGELLTALDVQLVTQYMEPRDYSHGIYIVYWAAVDVRPARWTRAHPDPNALAHQLINQARQHQPTRHIDVVILDMGPSG